MCVFMQQQMLLWIVSCVHVSPLLKHALAVDWTFVKNMVINFSHQIINKLIGSHACVTALRAIKHPSLPVHPWSGVCLLASIGAVVFSYSCLIHKDASRWRGVKDERYKILRHGQVISARKPKTSLFSWLWWSSASISVCKSLEASINLLYKKENHCVK